MNFHPKQPIAVPSGTAEITLSDVLDALGSKHMRPNRLRDLRSAVRRVAELLGQSPGTLKLDLPVISARLGAINPIQAGMSSKRLSNIRSDFLAAVRLSGLAKLKAGSGQTLSRSWEELLQRVDSKRARIGLSRLARYASANGLEPPRTDDLTLECFIAWVRAGSLHRKPDKLHRTVALIWNEVAKLPDLDLKRVSVPSFQKRNRRIEWDLLPASFRKDVDEHLDWCRGSDPFDAQARSRPLATQSVHLRRDQIHTAVTALVESGVAPDEITSLAALVSPEALKRILRRRLETDNGRKSVFSRDLGAALVQIAREWVHVNAAELVELRRLVGKMPVPLPGLTDKNKRFLRQFDDPEVTRRLFDLPGRLWAEVRRDSQPGFRILAKAQAALAIALLPYIPIRIQNLAALAFNVHLFLASNVRTVSTLELPGHEVKNGMPMAFDIPPHVAKLLIEYRDRIAFGVLGRRPMHVFINPDGRVKSKDALSDLITRTLKRRAGIVLTAHQFRHLSAKLLLDAVPGSYETVRQLLGHKNSKTPVNFYSGIDTRRAARHHYQLIQQALAAPPLPMRRKRKRGGNT